MDVRKWDTFCYLLSYVGTVQFYGENVSVLQVGCGDSGMYFPRGIILINSCIDHAPNFDDGSMCQQYMLKYSIISSQGMWLKNFNIQVISNIEIIGLIYTCGIEDAHIFMFCLVLCRSRPYDGSVYN